MSEHEAVDVEPMNAKVRDYVAAFAAVERPDSATRKATWAAIELEVVPPRRRGLAVAVGAAVAIAAAVIVLVAGVQRAVLGVDRADPGVLAQLGNTPVDGVRPAKVSREPHVSSDPVPDPPAPVDAVAVPGAEQSPGPIVDPVERGPNVRSTPAAKERSTKPASPAVEDPPPPTSTLAAELRSFKAAKHALDSGKPKQALREVDRYAERFPRGSFRLEAQLLRAEALCANGRAAKARQLRADFIAAHPSSPLARRMREVCRD